MTRTAAPPTAVLALVAAAGPFSTDAYVSALPDVQRELHTSSGGAQLSMTACIIGLAVGMTLSGPLSDARGRRPFLIVGTSSFAACSVLCALAPSIEVLIGARLVQGLAAGAAAPIGRAVISDLFDEDAAAKRFGTLISVALLAPVVSPAVGGALLHVGSWRTVFWFLVAAGVVMLAVVVRFVPESLPADRRQPGGVAQLRDRVADLLSDREYLGPLLVQCSAIAGLFVYVGGSSFVLQQSLGISSGTYSVVFATDAAVMAAASVLFRLSVGRLGAPRLRMIGLLTSALCAIALLALCLVTTPDEPLVGVWLLLAGVLGGLGLSFPAATVLAQEAGTRSAGTAASLLAGTGYLVAAVATPLTGLLGSLSPTTMALLMAVFFVVPTSALTATLRHKIARVTVSQ